MRKQARSAAIVLTALLGATSLFHPALAQENQDRTDSAEYTESRADYWAAREAWAAKKAAQDAGEDVSDEPELPGAAEAPPVAAAPAASAPDGYPTNSELHALRVCESTDNYTINTGNGYYGAYQFSPVTWWWLGYVGYPHEAAPSVQDEAARYLWSLMGWSPWPSCARYLGFL